MVVQRAYGAEIYNMMSGVGDRFVENRQNALRNEIANRSYARQLEQDDLVQQRWLQEQEFEKQKWDTQSELERQKFELEKQKAAGTATSAGEWGLTPGFYDTGGKGDPKDFVPTYTSKNGRMTVGGDTTPYDLSGNSLDGSGKKLDMTRYLTIGEKEQAKAAGTATGKGVGEQKLKLPLVKSRISRQLGLLKQVYDDPFLPKYVGPVSSILPNVSEEATNLEALIEEITSGSFIEGFESIKGAGAITEREGEAATLALSRLKKTRQGSAQYRAAIAEYANHLIRMEQAYEAIANGTLDPASEDFEFDPTYTVDKTPPWMKGKGAAAEPAGAPPAPEATVPAPGAADAIPEPAAPAAAAPASAATAAPAQKGKHPIGTSGDGRTKISDDPALGADNWVPDNDPRAVSARAGAGRGSVTNTATPPSAGGSRSVTVNSAGTPAVTPPPRDPVVTPIPNSPPPRQPAPGGTPGAGTLGGIMPGPGGAPLPGGLVPPQGGGGEMPEAGGGPPPPGGMAGPDPAEAPPEPTPFDQIRMAAYDKGKQEIIKRAIAMQKTRGTEAAQQWAEARLRELRERFGGIPQ
jgi:hypothetical protein